MNTTEKTRRRKKNPLSSREKRKDPIHVCCRLKPLKDDKTSTTCIKVISSTTLCLYTPTESRQVQKDLYYNFEHIFTASADQKTIFEHVAYPLIEDLLHAKNGLLFTYAVTGSGKTYTLTGEPNNPGIMPRTIYAIFNTIQDFQTNKFVVKSDHINGFEIQSEYDAFLEVKSSSSRVRRKHRPHQGGGDAAEKMYVNDGVRVLGINESNLYAIFVNYIEIYNNIVYDLLDDAEGKTLQSKILREDADKNMYVSRVVEIEVKTAAEAFEVFNIGQRRKRMGYTALNADSSRSHSIFNIRVVQVEKQNLIKVGQLSLVDLAGLERSSKTQNTNLRQKETGKINNSLMNLRTCLEKLRENQTAGTNHVIPYRNSRLTFFFKNYFEGHGRVEMIVCLNPSDHDAKENLQVVKFADFAQDVKISKPEVRYTLCKKSVKNLSITTPLSVPTLSLPKIPNIKLNFKTPESCGEEIDKLIEILRLRKEKTEAIDKEIANKKQRFCNKLIDINSKNVLGKSEIASLKIALKKERQKARCYDAKISNLKTANNNLISKQTKMEDTISSLRNTIDEKNLKINENDHERQKFKQELAQKSEELQNKLRDQRLEFQPKILMIENQLQKICEILESNLHEDQEQQKIDVMIKPELQTNELKVPEKENRRGVAQQQNSGMGRRKRWRSLEVGLERREIDYDVE